MDTIPQVLACDVGNTHVRLARVVGDEVSEPRRLSVGNLVRLGEATAELWGEMAEPRRVVAASVNPAALEALEAAALKAFDQQVLVVGRDLDLPISTDLPSPEAIGTDRLCAAVAAYDRLGRACIVADFGTAITIDCVNDEGVFVGGAILPGLAMSAGSLHSGTAQLPNVQITQPPAGPGRNTSDAIRSGVLAGARGALRHCVEAFAERLGRWPLVICTGRDAELVAGDMQKSDLVQAIVADLTLRGVALAYYKTLVK